jgi:hypothetical protein
MWQPPQRIAFKASPGRIPTREEAAASRLFSPLNQGPVRLTSRTWVPAMVPWRADPDGNVTQAVVDWYARLAEGQPGCIVIEATGIRDVPSGPLLRVGHDRYIEGLRRVADAIHSHSDGRTQAYIQLIDFLGVKRRPQRDKYLERFLRITDGHRSTLAMQGATDDAVRERILGLDDAALQAILGPREWESLQKGARERVTDTELPTANCGPSPRHPSGRSGMVEEAARRPRRRGPPVQELLRRPRPEAQGRHLPAVGSRSARRTRPGAQSRRQAAAGGPGGLVRSETCLITYFRTSARPVVRKFLIQWLNSSCTGAAFNLGCLVGHEKSRQLIRCQSHLREKLHQLHQTLARRGGMANQCRHHFLVWIYHRNGDTDHPSNELFLVLADHLIPQSIEFSVERFPIGNGLGRHLGKNESIQQLTSFDKVHLRKKELSASGAMQWVT